ncbi:hypothetical protein QBC47DRAFT_8502 [Echria macrotheca]|uniref:Uncharacterized protein n=1 Tax=Echria macrotheca TaxID=438768 RepID=A0AAJ0FGX4_9PEZI|nr:hypothetical protein QBC47DRAFT_8502 [Echria macrotheca]
MKVARLTAERNRTCPRGTKDRIGLSTGSTFETRTDCPPQTARNTRNAKTPMIQEPEPWSRRFTRVAGAGRNIQDTAIAESREGCPEIAFFWLSEVVVAAAGKGAWAKLPQVDIGGTLVLAPGFVQSVGKLAGATWSGGKGQPAQTGLLGRFHTRCYQEGAYRTDTSKRWQAEEPSLKEQAKLSIEKKKQKLLRTTIRSRKGWWVSGG